MTTINKWYFETNRKGNTYLKGTINEGQTIKTIWEGRKGMNGRKGRKGKKGRKGRKGRKGTVHKLEFLRIWKLKFFTALMNLVANLAQDLNFTVHGWRLKDVTLLSIQGFHKGVLFSSTGFGAKAGPE